MKDWRKEFDEKFGSEPDDAGCDGCSANYDPREEHKAFITSLLKEIREEMRNQNKIRCALCDGAKVLEHTLACKTLNNNIALLRTYAEGEEK